MQVNHQRIHKIFIAVSVFALALAVVPGKIFAAGSADSTYELRINILTDTSVEINLQTTIFNKTDQIVTRYEVALPYANPQNLVARRDGQAIAGELRAQRQYTVNFGTQALRPQQSATLEITYKLPGKLALHDGIYTLLVPNFVAAAGENSSYAVTVSYPESFPNLLYQPPSVVQDAARVLKGTNPRSLIFIWGKEVRVGLAEKFTADFRSSEGNQGQINLPPDYEHQDVYYQEIAANGVLAHQNNGNLWFLVDKQSEFAYKATVTLRQLESSTDFKSVEYGKFATNKDLNKLETQSEKIQALYDEVVERLTPEVQNRTTNEADIPKLQEKLQSTPINFTNLEYALYQAGLLQQAGFPARIVYGYVIGLDSLPNFNSTLPHVWVETQLDTRLITLDPYMEDLSSYAFYNTTRLNRLQFGVWDNNYNPDKLLGLLGGETLRPRPTLEAPQRDISQGTITMGAENFPTQATTANLFSGDLIVKNQTSRVIAIEKLAWDDVDITTQVISLNSFLTRAIRPQTTETLTAAPLILPNLIYDGTINHKFTLDPVQQDYQPAVAEVSITYVTNTRVLALVIVGGIMLMLFSFAVLFRREWVLKQWRLYLIRRR